MSNYRCCSPLPYEQMTATVCNETPRGDAIAARPVEQSKRDDTAEKDYHQ